MKAKLIILAICVCYCTIANAQLYGLTKVINPVSTENINSREISQVMDIRQNADTYISNNERTVVVKTWNEPKVKITTVIHYKGNSELTDQQWFERLGITMVNRGNFIDIRSYYSAGKYYNPKDKGREKGLFTGSMVLFNSNGDNIGSIDSKRIVTVYIPKWSRLEINVFRTELYLLNDIAKVEATLNSGSFGAQNIGELLLHATSADFDGGNIARADINFQSARFKARNIDDLKIKSTMSSVIVRVVQKAVIESNNDDYDFDEVGLLTGRKWYKTVRIEKLIYGFNINGMNADVKIRSIAATVDSIKLVDKYGDIRLSLDNHPNCLVNIEGQYNKVYPGAEKIMLNVTADDDREIPADTSITAMVKASTEKMMKKDLIMFESLPRLTNFSSNPFKTMIRLGDGKGLKVVVNCQSCTIDLK